MNNSKEEGRTDTIKIEKSRINKIDISNKLNLLENEVHEFDYKFEFSNDSVSQVLYVKKGKLDKKYDIPQNLKFTLLINPVLGTLSKKKIEGTAVLKSSSESFSDNNSINSSDYSGADYVFMSDCEFKVRMDTDKYEACAISTTCSDIKKFVKGYPDYTFMKRVSTYK